MKNLTAVICQGGKTTPIIQIIDDSYLVAGLAFEKLVREKAGYYDLYVNAEGTEEYEAAVICTIGIDSPCTSVKAGWLNDHVFRFITLKGAQPRDLDGSMSIMLQAK